ncbi:MAG: hypothetical protein HC855_03410 [Rhizobiales bacterium]|nr:hypothetical protein [Hyphomicrobiales bacterium]
MPVLERDPWRFQYFERIACPEDVLIPTDDPDCWELYPDFRWIYDKLIIARSQKLHCGTHQDAPERFPVFAKPAINLKGMGLGSRVIGSASEFESLCPPGHMWMELLAGEHVSTDCALVDGKLHWMRHATGIPWRGGMFQHWLIRKERDESLARYLEDWIARRMAGYTGMLNFETIGGRIIEAHLRFADQWCDLYGDGWIDALVELYARARWSFDGENRREGYSVPLFARHGVVPDHPPADVQAAIRARPHVKSLQITFHPTKPGEAHPMPPGGFRLAIVNCTDLEAGKQARRDLARAFPGIETILPE